MKDENTDSLGNMWQLAPGGRRKILLCQKQLWSLQVEIRTYGTLFARLSDENVHGEDLHGMGSSLLRMSRQLLQLSDLLLESLAKNEDPSKSRSTRLEDA